jgi:hypothetical protein
MPRGYPPHIQKAFDELRFGPLRTLNLRESLPAPSEARDRTERWVRAKQVEQAGELLIITGRGNNSEGGVSVVRQSVLALLPSLRRRNIISGWQEHTPGSFIVTLAPLSALFEAPKRRRERDSATAPAPPGSLAALSPDTLATLRRLAITSLEVLGVYDYDRFIEEEMTSKFAKLSVSLKDTLLEGEDPDAALHRAIRRALDELEG